MAFPPRPPLLPSVPMPGMVPPQFAFATNFMPTMRMPHMRPHLGSIPTPMGVRPPPHHPLRPMPPRTIYQSPILGRPPTFSQRIDAPGPAVTVFVGNITERAPDIMIRHILNSCGPVLNWKRVQGASGKLQGFGFCEFGSPDAALRAIRILHDYDIAGSKLVVKADAKTNEILDEFKEKVKKAREEAEGKEGEGSPLQDEKKEETETDDPNSYMNEDMKAEDEICGHRVAQIILEHRKDIANYVSQPTKQDTRDKRMNKAQEKLSSISAGVADIPNTLRLEDMTEIEEGKKEIISHEIMQFRETMKKQEEERERERKVREKIRERDNEIRRQHLEKRSRDKDRRRSASSRSSHSSSRSPSIESRHSSRRSRRRSHSKSRTRSPSRRSAHRDSHREREKNEEEKEKKEQERKIRKKEQQYQERLKNWESRELKKQKELNRESEKEKQKEMDREKDAKKLREFLEDYDDDRDDPKHYKGHTFQRKLTSREHEVEQDNKDRAKEKEELEELRTKIMSEGHENPELAYEQARQEREEQYKPKVMWKPANKPPSPPAAPLSSSSPPPPPRPPSPKEPPTALPTSPEQPKHKAQQNGTPFSDGAGISPHSPADDPPEEPLNDDGENSLSRDAFPSAEVTPQPVVKKKKFDIKDVFNQDDDEDAPHKKMKLSIPVNASKDKTKEKAGGEDKRKHIKSLIDKIPTSKSELFAYPIDASMVDSTLMEKRIRPWINKKIIEYIGEPEPTLVEFICSKVLEGSQPQSLLNDVQMVLDDEADVFVVKMWRLLIYEIEAKKMGLGKT